MAANAYAKSQQRTHFLAFVLACLFSGKTFGARGHRHALQADADRS
jgi:hypothetical protein